MVAKPAPSAQLSLALDGPALRDQALDLLEYTRADWLAEARVARDWALEEFGHVDADYIHDLCPIPKDIDPRVMGAVFRGLRFIRYQPSRRPECHARPIAVWGAK